MKKYILVFFALLGFAGCGATSQQRFVLNGRLKGIDTGLVRLVYIDESERTRHTVDSVKIVDGRFTMQGNVNTPRMMIIEVEPGNWSFNVFVENKSLEVVADTAGALHYDYTAYGEGKFAEIKNFTLTGSANFDAWKAYESDPGQRPFELAYERLNKKFIAAGKDIDAQYAVRAEIDSVSRKQEAWRKQYIIKYVDTNLEAVAGVYMFFQVFRSANQMPYKELEDMLKKFRGEAKASVYYQALDRSRANLKAVQPGEVAPDFTLLQRDSTKLTLSSTRGKYVLIDFWASWCHPCRKAIPHWKSVYEKYYGKGFDIISISNDNKWDMWTRAMDVEKMPWKQLIDEYPVKRMPARVISLYMITSIPHYMLLDKEGRILISTSDEQLIDKKISELLGG